MIWTKQRSTTAEHILVDRPRGLTSASGGWFRPNKIDVEAGSWSYDGVTSSGSNIVFKGLSGASYSANQNGATQVAWYWKAGGAAVSNTSGSITSSVSANADAGFSVGTYTGNNTAGATVGHGLSKTPELLICKRRDTTNEAWAIKLTNILSSTSDGLKLDDPVAAFNNNSIWWNSTQPSNSYFTLGSHATVNASSASMSFYAWHSVDGYSKVGSYTGNFSADGTFVYTGFRPKYVLIKRTNTAGSWIVQDGVRSPYNDVDDALYADSNVAEYSNNSWSDMDFTSNGFKCRTSDSIFNASGSTYIFLAFAEHPFKYANAR
jgi:hypothetical protein